MLIFPIIDTFRIIQLYDIIESKWEYPVMPCVIWIKSCHYWYGLASATLCGITELDSYNHSIKFIPNAFPEHVAVYNVQLVNGQLIDGWCLCLCMIMLRHLRWDSYHLWLWNVTITNGLYYMHIHKYMQKQVDVIISKNQALRI